MRSPTVTPKLQRIAAQAARDPDRVFTTLAYLIDEDFLREAYRRTSKSSAAGIDGVTAQIYAERLEENLRDLHARLRSGLYQAAPVERVWIEKDDGGRRPIGKPAFEDKIVQRAVAMLLEAIYEKTFSDCSYGFRQGRSPHEALHGVCSGCVRKPVIATIVQKSNVLRHGHYRTFSDRCSWDPCFLGEEERVFGVVVSDAFLKAAGERW